MRTVQHISFWLLASTFLVITFGQADGNYVHAFYFVAFLLPVAMATSYFFNYYLVPRYLLRRQYLRFGLYLCYTLVFSLYFEFIVLTLALIVLANYQYSNLNPYTTNILLLTSTLYFIVFVNAFVLLVKRYQRKEHHIYELEAKQERNAKDQIVIRADRKNFPLALQEIRYIESLADYVKIHTASGQVVTKEKISDLQDRLPDYFVRAHRSFLVNKNHISSFGREEMKIGEVCIPIGRTYRPGVMHQIGG